MWNVKHVERCARAVVLMAVAGQASAQTVWGIQEYGPSGYVNNLVKFEVGTPGLLTTIGPTGISTGFGAGGLEFGPGGKLYVASRHSIGFLHDVNLTTGTATNPRGSGLVPNERVADLSWDFFNHRMLAVGSAPNVGGSEAHLYVVDLTTGTLTNLGAISGNYPDNSTYSLAVRPADGAIFIHGVQTDRWYSVSPTTLIATALGPLGIDSTGDQGATFDPATGFLYHAILSTTGGNVNWLAVINTETGSPGLRGSIGSGLIQISDLAIRPPVCYADCDSVGGLTPNDFQCFLNSFNLGTPYANCDGVGGLTPNDFQCFLDKYVAGCT